jgi:hypothetical protein
MISGYLGVSVFSAPAGRNRRPTSEAKVDCRSGFAFFSSTFSVPKFGNSL